VVVVEAAEEDVVEAVVAVAVEDEAVAVAVEDAEGDVVEA